MTGQVDLGWVSGHYPDADASAATEDAWPAPTGPLAVARHMVQVDSLHDEAGVLTVRWWRGSFHLWTGTHWAEVADPAVRARIYHLLEHAKYWKADKDGEVELVAWAPTRRKVGDVLEALQAVVHLSEWLDPPAWIDGAGDRHLVAVQNGLLHLGTRQLEEHSPRLFNLTALPYDYDPAAAVPRRWLRFLRDLWPGDRESRRLLQEWFGYVLSGETNLHKILLLVGPPRSGKGTIARVLIALVGGENTAGPTLASLGQNFGGCRRCWASRWQSSRMPGWVATPSPWWSGCCRSPARTRSPSTASSATPWTGRLPTRFVVISNELPDLGDASGAIATRFLVLTLAKSWLGHEDASLTDQLLEELPGILLWALKGLDRLNEQGHFTEPASSRDAVIALADLASPVAAFVREACTREPGQEILVKDLYEAWRIWSKDHGRDRQRPNSASGGTCAQRSLASRSYVPTLAKDPGHGTTRASP